MAKRFIKHNSSRFADALFAEAAGLEALRQLAPAQLHIPEVFAVDARQIELTWIEAGRFGRKQWARLGAALAELHEHPQPAYGFASDNFIGLNPQNNGLSASWGEFFVECRLRAQIAMIEDQSLRDRFAARLDAAAAPLILFLDANCAYPSLVHGDLWHGNVLCDRSGGVWLIDPAVYWGDREVDLAMSEMFGGFDAAFHAAYDARLPRSASYAEKRPVYNLYHYLNHYNLFGSSYLDGCEAGFRMLERIAAG